MHPEVLEFVGSVQDKFPNYFVGVRVLEVGSRDVNGSVRGLFLRCDYVGIDCASGKGVDHVTLAHDYRPLDGRPFDTVVTTEALEHDPFWARSVRHCVEVLLRPGGLFIATWASPLRPEHGTRATVPYEGIYGPDPDYYRGISPEEFGAAVGDCFDRLHTSRVRDGQDVLAYGFRK